MVFISSLVTAITARSGRMEGLAGGSVSVQQGQVQGLGHGYDEGYDRGYDYH